MTFIPDGVWDNIKEFIIEYPHKTLKYDYWEDEDEGEEQESKSNHCIIMWNDENNFTNNMMCNDYGYSEDRIQNLMWIDYVKSMFNWNMGEKLYLFQKSKCDGAFYIYRSHDNTSDTFNDFYINEEGFVYRKYFNMDKYNKTNNRADIICKFQKVDSMYNNLLSK